MLIVSLAGTVVANLIAGTATTASILFFARLLDGITSGNTSVAQAVISDVTTPEDRAKGFGIFGAAFGLGFILGPAISLLAQQISLGASFLASGGIALIALLITIFLLPETITNTEKSHNIFDLGLGNLIPGLSLPKIGILIIIIFLIGTTFTVFTYAFQPYYINVLKQGSESLTLLFILFGGLGLWMQIQGIPILIRKFNLFTILFSALIIRSVSFIIMPLWAKVAYFVAANILFSIFNSGSIGVSGS